MNKNLQKGVEFFKMGANYEMQGDSISAIDNYEKALKTWKEILQKNENLEYTIAKTFYNLGCLYDSTDQINKAIEKFELGLSTFNHLRESNPKAIKYAQWVTATFERLGTICLDKKLNNEALDYFKSCFEIKKIIYEADPTNTAHCFSLGATHYNIGQTYMLINNVVDGKKHLYESGKIFRKVYDLEHSAECKQLLNDLKNEFGIEI